MSIASRLVHAFSFVGLRRFRKVSVASATEPPSEPKPSEESKEFDWKEALADAGIVAGVYFFTALVGMKIVNIIQDPVTAVVTAGIQAGLGFFMTLAIKRGLMGMIKR